MRCIIINYYYINSTIVMCNFIFVFVFVLGEKNRFSKILINRGDKISVGFLLKPNLATT